jgi:hypothetical protein
MPEFNLKAQNVRSINGIPLDESRSFNVYVGKNIPQSNEDVLKGEVRVIDEVMLDTYFKTQKHFAGYTRVPAKGMWTSEVKPFEVVHEESEMIILFDTTLQKVCDFASEFLDIFGQEAIYVDILESSQIVINMELFDYVADN